MKDRKFTEVIKDLKKSIFSYEYYVNYKKVFSNIQKYKIEFNILNSIIGSNNIKKDFEKIISKYPETLKAIPILLAVREYKMLFFVNKKTLEYNFKNKNMRNAKYSLFMEKTGLFNLLSNKKITNIIDYVTGVEVGLDSNARKNRTGFLMEGVVEDFIKKLKKIDYKKQQNKKNIKENYKIDLSGIVKKSDKKFDFVIKTTNHLYLLETNFYSKNGSKLNEIEKSYQLINDKIKKLENTTFIWITDGVGWKNANKNLEEAYDKIEHLYTIKDLENGILKKIIK